MKAEPRATRSPSAKVAKLAHHHHRPHLRSGGVEVAHTRHVTRIIHGAAEDEDRPPLAGRDARTTTPLSLSTLRICALHERCGNEGVSNITQQHRGNMDGIIR